MKNSALPALFMALGAGVGLLFHQIALGAGVGLAVGAAARMIASRQGN